MYYCILNTEHGIPIEANYGDATPLGASHMVNSSQPIIV